MFFSARTGIFHVRLSYRVSLIGITILLFLVPFRLHARWELDIETGLVFSGYNDIRIPNETGTKISLTEELETDPKLFFRTRLSCSISDKHAVSLLVAPLRLRAIGKVDRLVRFQDEEFPAGTPIEATYRFDSYRLTYRYRLHQSQRLHAGIGFTAKIRDASVSLEGDKKKSEKKNTGFVPLINFRLCWMFAKDLSLLLDGDALAAPQGRAEDVLLALQHRLHEHIDVKIGYRFLEGGADVDEVYSFALLNYLLVGVTVSL